MQGTFDASAAHLWQHLSATGITKTGFYKAHKYAFKFLMKGVDIALIFDTDTSKEFNVFLAKKKDEEVKKAVNMSQLGQSMLALEHIAAMRRAFSFDIELRLQDLQHLDFEETASAAFDTWAKQGAAELVRLGAGRFEKIKVEVNFLATNISVILETPYDDAVMRKMSHIKAAAVNGDLVEKFPWERILFGDEGVPGAPKHARLPQEVIDVVTDGRNAALGFLKPHMTTLNDWKKAMLAHERELLDMERSLSLDFEYLHGHAEAALRELVERRMFACLPDGLDFMPTVEEAPIGI